MSEKAAEAFVEQVSKDRKLAASIKDIVREAEEKRAKVSAEERRKLGELAKSLGFEFTVLELEKVLPEETMQKLHSAVLEWKGARILATGHVDPNAMAPMVAGDPGPGSVANKRGKKAPWRASW
jgi:hypothetical protein